MALKEMYENSPTVTEDVDGSDYDDDDDSDYDNEDFRQDLADDGDDSDFDDDGDLTPTPVNVATSNNNRSNNNKANNNKNNNAGTSSSEEFESEGFTLEGFNGEAFEQFTNSPKKTLPTKAKKTRTSSKEIQFRAYVYKVLKQVHPDTGVSKKALNQTSNLAKYVFETIVEQANRLLRMGSKSTLTSRDIQTSLRLTVPGELAKHGVSEASKAIVRFTDANDSPIDRTQRRKRISKSALAGLQFPVGRIARMMKEYLNGPRVSLCAPVYLAAVMEYLTAEVLELAGNEARGARRQRITPRDIFQAINKDIELHSLFNNLVILNGGAHIYILPALLPKRDGKGRLVKKSSKKTTTTTSPKKKATSPKVPKTTKATKKATSPKVPKAPKTTTTKKTAKKTKETFLSEPFYGY